MFQHTYSALLSGLSGALIEVECFIGNGLPYFNIVGIPGSAASSARERIRSALKSSGFSLPPSRITVNIRCNQLQTALSAAGYSLLDFPIALVLLACQSLIPAAMLPHSLFLGELSLNGDLKPISGALTFAHLAKRYALTSVFLPASNAAEAALSGHLGIYGLSTLSQAIALLRGQITCAPAAPAKPETVPVHSSFDAILGQDLGKRALMIAAAGMHNLLLIGPPGCGKTLLAKALPSLLPPLTFDEQLQLTEIYSCCGLLPAGQTLITQRPFRSPHHTVPVSAFLGGGTLPRPGELTLAHHGILYLDELSEFSRASLESLRQPLEDHTITINRLRTSCIYPADFLLAASMNPCPCGYYPDTARCHCSSSRIEQYYAKINTPLLDRIDLVIQLSPIPISDTRMSSSLSYANVINRVHAAHKRQLQRYKQAGHYNARMSLDELQHFCALRPPLDRFMQQAYSHYHLSLRSYHKILRVSRTLADLDDQDEIQESHLMEALQYRLRFQQQNLPQ